MDALQAGCHVFIEKPLSTNLQEAADIVALARARNLNGGGRPPVPARPQPGRGASSAGRGRHRPGPAGLRHPRPALARHARPGRERLAVRARRSPAAASWPTSAITWSTPCSGPPARSRDEVGAIQSRREPDIDLVTAAAIRLADGTPATLAISGVSPGPLFAIEYFGELGRLRATDQTLEEERPGVRPAGRSPCPRPPAPSTATSSPPSGASGPCAARPTRPSDTVRLLEAIARSAATRQVVRLSDPTGDIRTRPPGDKERRVEPRRARIIDPVRAGARAGPRPRRATHRYDRPRGRPERLSRSPGGHADHFG